MISSSERCPLNTGAHPEERQLPPSKLVSLDSSRLEQRPGGHTWVEVYLSSQAKPDDVVGSRLGPQASRVGCHHLDESRYLKSVFLENTLKLINLFVVDYPLSDKAWAVQRHLDTSH